VGMGTSRQKTASKAVKRRIAASTTSSICQNDRSLADILRCPKEGSPIPDTDKTRSLAAFGAASYTPPRKLVETQQQHRCTLRAKSQH
jgi:hypothetical protein